MKKTKKVKFKSVLIAIGALVAFFGLIFLLRENEKIAEFITQNLTRHISDAAGKFTSKFTFSFLEAAVIALIIALVVLLVVAVECLRKKKFKGVLKGFLIVLTIIIAYVDFYALTAGAAFYRAPIALPIYGDFDETYGADEVQKAAESFLFDYYTLYHKLEKDDYGEIKAPYILDELNDLLYEEFKRLDGKYFFENTPRVKAIDNAWFMDLAGKAGYAFVPFGESNIDATGYANYIPSTMAHEIAHSKGVTREAEANLVSAYILITSENEYLRYCGYLDYLGDLATAIKISDVYDFERAKTFLNKKTSLSSYGTSTSEYSMLEEHVLIPFTKLFAGLFSIYDGIYVDVNSYESPYGTIETGETHPDGSPVVKPIYSDLHKLFFSIYEEGRPWLTDEIMKSPIYVEIFIEQINVPLGSIYFSMGGDSINDGFIIITPDNVWTLYTTEYTDGSFVNKKEIIEPLFEIDFDDLPEAIKIPEKQYRTVMHGAYYIIFGSNLIAQPYPDLIIDANPNS
jgi:hypothetical protein